MTFPMRQIDPDAEAARLARERQEQPRDWPVLADYLVQLPDPAVPGGFTQARITVAAQRHRPVRPDIGDRLRDAVIGCLTDGPQ